METDDRRHDQRCVKDVGMHCSLLNGSSPQVVTVRNFSRRGVYFESAWNLPPGTLVVLRSMEVHDLAGENSRPRFMMDRDDPEACSTYRSHTLVSVRRSVAVDRDDGQPLFGVGAAVQIITD